MMNLQRFPPWLLQEVFRITYSPNLKPNICLTIYNQKNDGFVGRGFSVCEAAKDARKQRDNNKTLIYKR